MRVAIDFEKTSQPMIFDNVINTYEKGSFYCVHLENNEVKKIPVCNIFRVTESNASTENALSDSA